jgi:hypothetical protein
MKNIIQIIIATILFIACDNSKTPHPFDDNLKGNVKSVEQITYEAKEAFGELVKGERGDGWDEFYAEYNDFGQVLYKQKK